MATDITEANQSQQKGLELGLLSYILWGLFPLYFYLLQDVPPLVTLAFRTVFALLLLIPLIFVYKREKNIFNIFHHPKYIFGLFITMILICFNWGIFVWLVAQNQTLHASLGSYIGPLLTVFFSVIFLHERMNIAGYIAVFLAFIAVLVFAFGIGTVPWGSILAALSFTIYSLIRKLIPIDAVSALTVETIFAAPFCLAFILFADFCFADSDLWSHNLRIMTLLIGGGVLTAIPLLLFGAAMKTRIGLSTLGILQYICPTLQFLCAVVVFHEKMSLFQWISFAIIWVALLMFVFSLEQQHSTLNAPEN